MTPFVHFLSYIVIIRLEAMLPPAEYWIYSTGQFGNVHAFGYNSTESELLCCLATDIKYPYQN